MRKGVGEGGGERVGCEERGEKWVERGGMDVGEGEEWTCGVGRWKVRST